MKFVYIVLPTNSYDEGSVPLKVFASLIDAQEYRDRRVTATAGLVTINIIEKEVL